MTPSACSRLLCCPRRSRSPPGISIVVARGFEINPRLLGCAASVTAFGAGWKSVASEDRLCDAGAQEAECTRQYMSIPSTAGAQDAERSSFSNLFTTPNGQHRLARLLPQVRQRLVARVPGEPDRQSRRAAETR